MMSRNLQKLARIGLEVGWSGLSANAHGAYAFADSKRSSL